VRVYFKNCWRMFGLCSRESLFPHFLFVLLFRSLSSLPSHASSPSSGSCPSSSSSFSSDSSRPPQPAPSSATPCESFRPPSPMAAGSTLSRAATHSGTPPSRPSWRRPARWRRSQRDGSTGTTSLSMSSRRRPRLARSLCSSRSLVRLNPLCTIGVMFSQTHVFLSHLRPFPPFLGASSGGGRRFRSGPDQPGCVYGVKRSSQRVRIAGPYLSSILGRVSSIFRFPSLPPSPFVSVSLIGNFNALSIVVVAPLLNFVIYPFLRSKGINLGCITRCTIGSSSFSSLPF
jgi:hypothetical protein